MSTVQKILTKYKYHLSDEQIAFDLDGPVNAGIKNNYNISTVSLIHSFIDHTSLNGKDNEETIKNFVDKLKNNLRKHAINKVAAICVFPKYIDLCREELKDYGIRIACVAGGFPYVQTYQEIRDLECKIANESSCDEIDIVIPLGEAYKEDLSFIREDLKRMREVCKDKTLKVILETGELKSAEQVFAISIIAMEEGADFIKTSTGKASMNATVEAVYAMSYAIKQYYAKTGKKVGIKIAGGVSSTTKAIQFLSVVKFILGEEWLSEQYFRIGTSSLTEKIQKEYLKLKLQKEHQE